MLTPEVSQGSARARRQALQTAEARTRLAGSSGGSRRRISPTVSSTSCAGDRVARLGPRLCRRRLAAVGGIAVHARCSTAELRRHPFSVVASLPSPCLPPSLCHGAPPLPARASLPPSAPPHRRCCLGAHLALLRPAAPRCFATAACPRLPPSLSPAAAWRHALLCSAPPRPAEPLRRPLGLIPPPPGPPAAAGPASPGPSRWDPSPCRPSRLLPPPAAHRGPSKRRSPGPLTRRGDHGGAARRGPSRGEQTTVAHTGPQGGGEAARGWHREQRRGYLAAALRRGR
ncbi:hypothetical protein PVAP13_2KG022048 [Panicum virgatum]|uniref:Uncharacterized protein n=1 Tax=Panicum virgatum TaxID=38727 RepID=A0A8T0W4U3_PANVG|nr:hypothetical protein PVAP13_2KG022048 [Panicum virgatum]